MSEHQCNCEADSGDDHWHTCPQRLDDYVWQQHQQNWDTKHPHAPPFTRAEWHAYFVALHAEAVGYWHGGTGRLVERLRITDDDWTRFVRLQNGGVPAVCHGDSSHDLTYLIESAAVFEEIHRGKS